MPTTQDRPPTAPSGRLARTAARVDAATPPDRDRLMDALRVLAMLAVAIGHWLLAVVVVQADGSLVAGSLLAEVPATQLATWLLQVVPLFVVVAGWSSARSLGRHDGSRADWVHARVRRLLLPTTAYALAALLVVAVVVAVAGDAPGRLVEQVLGVHLWFAASICATWLLTPWLHGVWTSLGVAVLPAGLGAVVAVDVAVRGLGLDVVGWANFLLVYGFCTFLGFAWHDGRLTRTHATRMLVGGAAAMALATASPWYPLSLVGVPGATQSNNSPLSVLVALVAVVHVGGVLLAGPWLRRRLARPVVWLAVVSASRVAVTVYLWHLLAMVLLVGALSSLAPATLALGPSSVAWWATRPLWLGALVLVTVPLVVLAARFEQRPARGSAPGRDRTVLGTVLASWGCTWTALAGPVPAAVGLLVLAAAVGRWLPRVARRV